jgi:hypothetical protein
LTAVDRDSLPGGCLRGVRSEDLGLGAALAAHIFAVAGVLLGITALALGSAPSTEANTIYHRVILGVLVVVLVLLVTRSARIALGRRKQPRPEKWQGESANDHSE